MIQLAATMSEPRRSAPIDDPTLTVDAQLHKVVAGQPGRELYTVALAGESALPSMHGVAFLAEALDTKELF